MYTSMFYDPRYMVYVYGAICTSIVICGVAVAIKILESETCIEIEFEGLCRVKISKNKLINYSKKDAEKYAKNKVRKALGITKLPSKLNHNIDKKISKVRDELSWYESILEPIF